MDANPASVLETITISDDNDDNDDIDEQSDCDGVYHAPSVEANYSRDSGVAGIDNDDTGRGIDTTEVSYQQQEAHSVDNNQPASTWLMYGSSVTKQRISIIDADGLAAGPSKPRCDLMECLVIYQPELKVIYDSLASIQEALDHVKAGLLAYDQRTSQSASQRAKRKRADPLIPSRKKQRQKEGHEIRIRATAAWVKFHDDEEPCKFLWARCGDGHCWVTDGRLERQRVDGGYLLCCGVDLAVEIRANAHDHPIVVEWNHDKEIFEGWDIIEEGRRLTITDAQMIDLVNGRSGDHVGFVDQT